MKDLSVALWAVNFNYAVKSQADWIALVTAQLEEAAAQKMDMLVIPEHISESWINYNSSHASETAEGEWVLDQAAQIIPLLQDAVKKTNVALAAGSSIYRDEKTGEKFNRAWVLFPDRPAVYHDKCVLTPPEKASEAYSFNPGDKITTFEWRGWKLSMMICLDIEMPMLSHILAGLDIDMLIVPTLTTKQAGYYRVFNCARARAVEIMTAVCVVGAVGGPADGISRGSYNGGAAVYVPSEEIFGHTGIFADIPVHDCVNGIGNILYAKDIPLGKIRETRRGQPEAWPGPWDADHIKIRKA